MARVHFVRSRAHLVHDHYVLWRNEKVQLQRSLLQEHSNERDQRGQSQQIKWSHLEAKRVQAVRFVQCEEASGFGGPQLCGKHELEKERVERKIKKQSDCEIK